MTSLKRQENRGCLSEKAKFGVSGGVILFIQLAYLEVVRLVCDDNINCLRVPL